MDEQQRQQDRVQPGRLDGPAGNLLVAVSVPDSSSVVVTPAAVLDAVVDGLAGEVA